jgi:hypothetical protein
MTSRTTQRPKWVRIWVTVGIATVALALLAAVAIGAVVVAVAHGVASQLKATPPPNRFPPFVMVGQKLNGIGSTTISDLSCTSDSNCLAVGLNASNTSGIFLLEESDGTWGDARPLKVDVGDVQGESASSAVASCWSPGDCTLLGDVILQPDGHRIYESQNDRAFSVSSRDGHWGPPELVLGSLVSPRFSDLYCWGPGACAAAGTKVGSDEVAGTTVPIVLVETDGVWKSAVSMSPLGSSDIDAFACTSSRTCIAGASNVPNVDGYPKTQAFVATLDDGAWSASHRIGTGIGRGENVQPAAASCAGPSFCEMVVDVTKYQNGSPYENDDGDRSFELSFRDGRLGPPAVVPYRVGATTIAGDLLSYLSCWSPGDCLAEGSGDNRSHLDAEFTMSLRGSEWSAPSFLGLHSRLLADAGIDALVCTGDGACSAVGTTPTDTFGLFGHEGLNTTHPFFARQPTTFEPLALSCVDATCTVGGALSLTADPDNQDDQPALAEVVRGRLLTLP